MKIIEASELLIFLKNGNVVGVSDSDEMRTALADYDGEVYRVLMTGKVLVELAESEHYHQECVRLRQIVEDYADQIKELSRRYERGSIDPDLKVAVVHG